MGRARAGVIATAAAAAGFTVAVGLVPQLHFAYRRPALHVALETTASLVALLAAFLIFGRFRRRARLNELLLACGLGLLALSNLFFGTLPTFVHGTHEDITVWAALVGSLLGALLFALAAFGPRRLLRRPRAMLLAGGVAVAAALALTAALVLAFGDRLPRGVATQLAESAARPSLDAHPALLALQLVVGGLYALAAVGFLMRSERLGDEFYGWIAVGAVLAAVARINYFLYPSLYSEWVYTGDAYRLAFYAVLLVGSMREISAYWRALSDAAVLEERRRIARNLHDGLAQELAYIGRNLSAVEAGANHGAIERLRRAVDRAQLESRQAITALTAPAPEAVEVELAEAASEVAERLGVGLELDLVPGARLSAARTEALVRIACEAVTNAARHSGAETVTVTLERSGSRVRLRVADAGRGFDPGATDGGGFGLVSMQERARSVGGELHIESAPARGTAVEVTV